MVTRARERISYEFEASVMSLVALSDEPLYVVDAAGATGRARSYAARAYNNLEDLGFVIKERYLTGHVGKPGFNAAPTKHFWSTAANVSRLARIELPRAEHRIMTSSITARESMEDHAPDSHAYIEAERTYLGGAAVLGARLDLSELEDWYPVVPGWTLLIDMEATHRLASV